MSKKKREKPVRQRTPVSVQVPDSYGEELLGALERAGAPLTLAELRDALAIHGREGEMRRAAFNALRPSSPSSHTSS